jgi:hypothetical protein
MKSIICTILTILGLVYFGSFSSHAAKEKSASTIEFSCVAWKSLDYLELFYRNGDDYINMEVPRRMRSEVYSLQALQSFELYTRVADADGASRYELVGKGMPRAGAGRMLFILEKNAPDADLPLHVRGFDDSLETCPIGAFCFVNFTGMELELHFGESVTALHTDAITVIQDAIPPAGGFIPFFLKDSEDHIVFESRLFGQPSQRKIVFIYPPKADRRKFSVQFLSESGVR